MIGPELQIAIRAALALDPVIAGGRIYDNPPPEAERVAATGAAWPLITIGDDQVIDAGDGCFEGWEVTTTLHIWSRSDTKSKIEAKAVAAAIVERLERLAEIDGYQIPVAALETVRSFRDDDGITEHGVVNMRFLLDPA